MVHTKTHHVRLRTFLDHPLLISSSLLIISTFLLFFNVLTGVANVVHSINILIDRLLLVGPLLAYLTLPDAQYQVY